MAGVEKGNDGFQVRYAHPVAAPGSGTARQEVLANITLIWPDGATADEVGKALTTATAHALATYTERTEG